MLLSISEAPDHAAVNSSFIPGVLSETVSTAGGPGMLFFLAPAGEVYTECPISPAEPNVLTR